MFQPTKSIVLTPKIDCSSWPNVLTPKSVPDNFLCINLSLKHGELLTVRKRKNRTTKEAPFRSTQWTNHGGTGKQSKRDSITGGVGSSCGLMWSLSSTEATSISSGGRNLCSKTEEAWGWRMVVDTRLYIDLVDIQCWGPRHPSVKKVLS